MKHCIECLTHLLPGKKLKISMNDDGKTEFYVDG